MKNKDFRKNIKHKNRNRHNFSTELQMGFKNISVKNSNSKLRTDIFDF